MVDISVLPAFVATILMFLAPPGPDMMLMLTVGLQGGPSAAVKAIAGIATGMSIYMALVTVGLGALAAAHPGLLGLVELFGAAYLVYLAWTTWKDSTAPAHEPSESAPSVHWFSRGLTVALSNPKLMLFFAAVLPRFTGAARSEPHQLALLGGINIALEVILYGAIGIFAGSFQHTLSRRPRVGRYLHRFAAVVYLVLAAVIAYDVITT